jgi:hypothetical protein
MTETGQDQDRQEDLRRLLTDAIEVQLAALKAGISFWTEWIEQTGEFVNSATKALASINAEDQQAKDVLLELVDAGRASMRSMTEIPRHSALRFIEELDRVKQETSEQPAQRTARKATRRSAEQTAGSGTRAAGKAASAGAAKKTAGAAKKTAGAAKKTAGAAKKTAGGAKKTAGAGQRKRAARPGRAARVTS